MNIRPQTDLLQNITLQTTNTPFNSHFLIARYRGIIIISKCRK